MRSRKYSETEQRRLTPTELGRTVNKILVADGKTNLVEALVVVAIIAILAAMLLPALAAAAL